MLTTIEKVLFLQDIDVFAEVTTEQLSHIASITEEIEMDADMTIMLQDEPANALYLVVEGAVRLHRDGRDILVAREKEVFGAWSLFDNEQANVASATTLEPTRLLKIDREAFYEIVADYVEITQGIFKSLARRVRQLGERFMSAEREEANR